MMRQYYVTYDILTNNKCYPCGKRVFANNKKEACQIIKDNYWESVQTYINKGYATSTARRFVKYPFHIRAERM